MNLKHIQNEKTVEDIINRLQGSHGPECGKSVEENMRLRDEIDGLTQQLAELKDENQAKDVLLDEVMEGVQGLRKQMQSEIESFTRVCLQLEVQKFHSETLMNLLKQNDIKLPNEISDLLNELEQVDNVDHSDTIVLDPEDEELFDSKEDG